MQKWWVTNGATVEIFHHQSQIVTFHWHEIKVLVEREVWNFEVPYLCLSAFSVKWQQMTALGRAAGIKEKRKHLTPSVDWCPFTGSDLVYVATSSLHVQYWPGWGFFFFCPCSFSYRIKVWMNNITWHRKSKVISQFFSTLDETCAYQDKEQLPGRRCYY